jgi:hypothetical protein
MSLTTNSKNDEPEIGSDRFYPAEGHVPADQPPPPSDFFASAPSEYIDSMSILPDSDSLEHLNDFFEETTSRTPAENADNLIHCENAHGAGEPETFSESPVGNFIDVCTRILLRPL